MKKYEQFAELVVPPGVFFVVRCDGSNFSSLTHLLEFQKPFDEQFHHVMTQTGIKCIQSSMFHPLLVYTFSDEINILFEKNESVFNRRVEKLVSELASLCTAYSSLSINHPAMFDARVIILPTEQDVITYLIARQLEAFRNCLNAYVHHILVQNKGLSALQASIYAKNWKRKKIQAFLKSERIKWSDIPPWHYRGTLIRKESFSKKGFNPMTKQEVLVARNRPLIIDNPPNFSLLSSIEEFLSIGSVLTASNTKI